MTRADSPQLGLVLDLAREVTARRDLDDVLSATFRCLRPMLEFSGGSIQLLDDEGWIRMAACDPAAPPHVMEMRIPLSSTLGGRIILTEQPVYVPDVEMDAAVPANRQHRATSRGVRSYLGVPLMADGRAIGILQVDSPAPAAWRDDDRVLLSSIAPIVAAAIQNARAHQVRTAAFRRLAEADREREAVAELVTGRLRPLTFALRSLARDAEALDPGGVLSRLRRIASEARRLEEVCTELQRMLGEERASSDRADAEQMVGILVPDAPAAAYPGG